LLVFYCAGELWWQQWLQSSALAFFAIFLFSVVLCYFICVFQAIELSAQLLTDHRFIQEQKTLTKYFSEMARDTGA
jgi:hypothetical protein